jgi:hypothetical protein
VRVTTSGIDAHESTAKVAGVGSDHTCYSNIAVAPKWHSNLWVTSKDQGPLEVHE